MFISLEFIKTETKGPILLFTEGLEKDNIEQSNRICEKLEKGPGLVVKRVSCIPELRKSDNNMKHLLILDSKAWSSSVKLINKSLDSPYIVLHVNVMEKLLETDPQKWSWNGSSIKNFELGMKRCYVFATGQCDTRLEDSFIKLLSDTHRDVYNKRTVAQRDWREKVDKIKQNIKYSNGIVLSSESTCLSAAELIIVPFTPVLMLNSASQSDMILQQELLKILATTTTEQKVLLKGNEWIENLLKEEYKEGNLLTSFPAKPLAGLIFQAPHLHMEQAALRSLSQLGGRISMTDVPGALRILPPNFQSFQKPGDLSQADIHNLRVQNINCLNAEWFSKCLKEKKIVKPIIFIQPPYLPPFMEQFNLNGYRFSILLQCPTDKSRAEKILSKLGATIVPSTDPDIADCIITEEIESGCNWEQRARTFKCLNDFFNQNIPHQSLHCPSVHIPTRVPASENVVVNQKLVGYPDEKVQKQLRTPTREERGTCVVVDEEDSIMLHDDLLERVWGSREDSLDLDVEIE